MPASDVYAWAKASSKPSYTKSEVGLSNVANERQYSANNPPPVTVTNNLENIRRIANLFGRRVSSQNGSIRINNSSDGVILYDINGNVVRDGQTVYGVVIGEFSMASGDYEPEVTFKGFTTIFGSEITNYPSNNWLDAMGVSDCWVIFAPHTSLMELKIT